MPTDSLSLARHFADLPDPRIDRTKKHALGDILVIALAAVVCGANSWEDFEEFGRAKEPLFANYRPGRGADNFEWWVASIKSVGG